MGIGVIFNLAENFSHTGGFSLVWTAFGVGMALLFALVALGYRAGWFLPKYRLTAADLMQDSLARQLFGPPEMVARSRRQAQVVPRCQLAGYRSEGFHVVRVAFGRETLIGSQCVYAAPREDGTCEEQVLVARSSKSKHPLSPQEQLNELGRTLAALQRMFSTNAREVAAARGYQRERLRGLKQRYDAIYAEYRNGQSGGEGGHAFSVQLADYDAKIKDLNRLLDGMK